MSKILELIPGLDGDATVTRFSELTGKSKSVISDHKNKGVLKGKSFLNWLHSYMAHLSKVAAGRGDTSERLVEARIDDLETKSGVNRLTYHEKLGTLIPIEESELILTDWANYTAQEVQGSFLEYTSKIEQKYNLEIDDKFKNETIRTTFDRIQNYAEKLASPSSQSSAEGIQST